MRVFRSIHNLLCPLILYISDLYNAFFNLQKKLHDGNN